MANLGPQYPNLLPEDPLPEIGAAWDADVLQVPRHPRALPLPFDRPIPVQLHGDVRVPQNVMVSKCYHDLHPRTLIYIIVISSRQ
jgi:hypothetical protein